MKSKILVFTQFFIIFLMVLPVSSPSKNFYIGMFFILLGGFVGFMALRENKMGNFNIRPDIKDGSSLVTSGIYSYIRHPMYTAVLTAMLGVTVFYPNTFEIILYVLLLSTLLLKLFYEESLWIFQSAEYAEYSLKTRRLIPFVF